MAVRRGSVVVIGGGIGGLSTAIALRAAGYEVQVVEIRADLHSSVYGVGIIQPINALRALRELGCAEACMEAGYSTSAWGRILDVDGEVVGEMPGASIPGSGLPPMNGLPRPVLHRILTDRAIETGVSLDYEATFAELSDLGDRVRVVFGDGSADVFDLVVGADGVRSEVRPRVLPEQHRPTYLGQSAFRINIPRLSEIDRIVLQNGPHGIAGFVPIGPEMAYLFYNTTWDEGARLQEDTMDQVLREHLAPFGGLTGRVRDEHITNASGIVFRPADWMIAPRPWHHGRIVLVGDAVHAVTPHLGQGAALAIEDGVVLAESLATHDEPEAAFEHYAERRYERCELIVESSVRIGGWEMDPASHADFDHAATTQAVLEEMVRPI